MGALDRFGAGVALGFGVGRGVGVARGRGVGVAFGVGRGVAEGLGLGVAVGLGVASGVAAGVESSGSSSSTFFSSGVGVARGATGVARWAGVGRGRGVALACGTGRISSRARRNSARFSVSVISERITSGQTIVDKTTIRTARVRVRTSRCYQITTSVQAAASELHRLQFEATIKL